VHLHLFDTRRTHHKGALYTDTVTGNTAHCEILVDVLVPVPLHPKRLRERGYNQSELLARELGKLCDLPVVDDCLFRRLNTPPQAQSSGVNERRYNIINAFSCRDNKLEGKSVLLIDDVATSGSTLNTCARELKYAGAASVQGLVVALEL